MLPSESALRPRTPEYKALHHQVNKRFIKAGVCERCGESKRTCWSSTDHTYTLEREDWRELCYSCHARVDAGDSCKRGHAHTQHSWIDKLGKRHCRECHRIRDERDRREAGIPPGPHRKGASSEYVASRQRDENGQFVCVS